MWKTRKKIIFFIKLIVSTSLCSLEKFIDTQMAAIQ